VTSIICVCVGDADALLLLRILYSFFFFFFLLLIPLSHQNLRSLLLAGNRRDRINPLTQGAGWSLFVVDYFIL